MTTPRTSGHNTARPQQVSTLHHDKTRILRRILWWTGLALFLPTFEGWTRNENPFWIFRNFPTPVPPHYDHCCQPNIVYQRIALALLVGFGCWCLVGILKFISIATSTSTSPPPQQNRIREILTISVTLCVTIIAGLTLIVVQGIVTHTPS